MPTARVLGPLVSLLVGVLLLGGCASVDEEAVDAIGDLPGIDYALSSCDLSDCVVTVRAEPDVTSDELVAALAAARDTDADQIDLRAEGAGDLAVAAGSDPTHDAAAVELALGALQVPGVTRFSMALSTDRTDAGVSAADDDTPWDVAEAVWPDLEDLPSPSLTVTRATSSDQGAARLVADDAFPAAGVALVRRLEGDETVALSGAVVDGDDVLLGVRDVAGAEALEALLADDPQTDGLTVVVAVTTNVLSYRADVDEPTDTASTGATAPGAPTEADRRALLTALETGPDGFSRIEGSTIVLSVTDLAAAAEVVDAARAAEPEAAGRVPLTVTQYGAAGTTVELGTTGSTDLLLLAARLAAVPTAESVTVEAADPDDDADPPYDSDAFVRVEVAAPDLATGVRTVAAAVGGWEGTPTSLVVGVTAVDPEGRTPGVTLRVDHDGGTWTAEGVRGTDETNATGVAAWEEGLAGAQG